MGSNLGHPGELGRRLLVEAIHHVVGHALLGYDDFLATIDDEIAALVISAVLAIFHSLVLVQILQLTEVTSKHDWHLADVDTSVVLLENDPLDSSLPHACLRAIIEVVFEFFLAKLDISIELGRVGQVSHASLVREHGHHAIV